MAFNLKVEPSEWHDQPVRWGHPIHHTCSYMASFPPRVPHYFIDRFTEKGDTVLDPFSGRGTTAAEACLMGRVGVGADLNPIAYVLTKAKVQTPRRKAVLSRVDDLESSFEPQDGSEVPGKISMLYSKKTLEQLLYLKRELNPRRSIVDNFITAVILGGLHGDSRLPSYMSIPMPNTFSMSPNYVRKFIREHKLRPPRHNAFDVITHRLSRLFKEGMAQVKGRAYLRDIRKVPSVMRGTKADLIFTSPPYLKVIKYGKQNWIRLWMLDVEPTDLDKSLDDKHTLPRYIRFIEEVINTLARVMKDDALCFLVVGQVGGRRGPGKNRSVRLGNMIRRTLEDKVDLTFLEVIDDRYDKKVKVSRIWGKEKRGRATAYDQILVLGKDAAAVGRKKFKETASWDRTAISHSQTTLRT